MLKVVRLGHIASRGFVGIAKDLSLADMCSLAMSHNTGVIYIHDFVDFYPVSLAIEKTSKDTPVFYEE